MVILQMDVDGRTAPEWASLYGKYGNSHHEPARVKSKNNACRPNYVICGNGDPWLYCDINIKNDDNGGIEIDEKMPICYYLLAIFVGDMEKSKRLALTIMARDAMSLPPRTTHLRGFMCSGKNIVDV